MPSFIKHGGKSALRCGEALTRRARTDLVRALRISRQASNWPAKRWLEYFDFAPTAGDGALEHRIVPIDISAGAVDARPEGHWLGGIQQGVAAATITLAGGSVTLHIERNVPGTAIVTKSKDT